MTHLQIKKFNRDSKRSSERILQPNQRHIVRASMPNGQKYLDEVVVLEEHEKAAKIKSMINGVMWAEWDNLESSIKVLFVIPFKKKTLRDSVKIWLVKHL